MKEQLIDFKKNYTLKSSIAVLPKVFPFTITSKEQFYCITTDAAKILRVATMKRQMLLKPELQIDFAIVSKDKDILDMIWAFSKLNITKK